jgi:hypothetical protein
VPLDLVCRLRVVGRIWTPLHLDRLFELRRAEARALEMPSQLWEER